MRSCAARISARRWILRCAITRSQLRWRRSNSAKTRLTRDGPSSPICTRWPNPHSTGSSPRCRSASTSR
ncbi:hypothetical protein UP10_29925 [Bradyrhizobium sp. LTSPM299]|nr:hypothetical protein UP10_29925 [Bradyrhizobium sp. LTSPM299]